MRMAIRILPVLLFPFLCPKWTEAAPLIVDWGHDWGSGWYAQQPDKDQNSPWRKLAEIDINENGTTDDDRTAGWAFSLNTTLSPNNMIYDYTYPSAKFYGAAIVQVTDIPKKENGSGYENIQAPTEGHINQNHELRDDWNLMCFPTKRRQPELSRYAGALLALWKKEDFLNGGDRFCVSFGDDSYIGVFVSRYWGGINWGRWVVMQDGQLYVSKDTFAGQTEQFDLTGAKETNGAHNPVVRTTHAINPGKTEWAPHNPTAPHNIYFDAANAQFKPMTFQNVEAVGFLAQRDLSTGHPVAGGLWDLPHGIGEPVALKYNAVQVRADVDSPKNWSAYCDLAPVGESLAGKAPVSYRQWIRVLRWAATNQRTRNFSTGFESFEIPGYSFFSDGAISDMETGTDRKYSPDEPVAAISWYDAIIWCNALSELEGLTPAYYDDAEYTVPAREVFNRAVLEGRNKRKAVYWKHDSNGYRLPTEMELYTAPKSTEKVVVSEYIWDASDAVYNPDSQRWHKIISQSSLCPARQKSPLPFGEEPFNGSPGIGFRIWRGAPATAESAAKPALFSSCQIEEGEVVKPEAPLSEDALRELAKKTLHPVLISKVGGLSENDIIERNYPETGQYDLEFAAVETPYGLWTKVRQWAELTKGYHFNYSGDMGSLRYLTPQSAELPHTPDEPVTQISWLDAIIWCNALSELFGRDPVYLNKITGEPLREASTFRVESYNTYGYANTGNYNNRPVDTAAIINLRTVPGNNGFRLPTQGEFKAAHTASNSEESGWFLSNSGGSTHPVATKAPDANGLYDMDGNVAEMTYGGDRLNGQTRASNHFADAPGSYPHQMTNKELPFTGRSYLGFRVASRP